MDETIRMCGAFALAFAVTGVATPLARKVAVRTGFLDHPGGYKGHGRATPYLGGCAVTVGFLAGAFAFAAGFRDLAIVCATAVALLALGTVDDKVGLGVTVRLAGHLGAGIVVWFAGAGWSVGADGIDLVLTVLWVVGLINAFNLMDNLDGATASLAATSAAGIALIALAGDAIQLAALALALSGACAGFLPFNLATPSRIFLGDGGSTMIGFVLAAGTMTVPSDGLDWAIVLVSVPLVGLAIFDTALVVMSRRRRGVPVLTGGRDHVTHRLLRVVGTPRRVAAALVAGQLALCLLALWLHGRSDAGVIASAGAYAGAALLGLVLFERPPLAPAAPSAVERSH